MPYYFPTTYQPYQFQQPFQNYTPQNYSQQNSGMIWVSGEQEAQSFPVAPNAAVALWDSNGRTVYLKQADASGKPTLKAFDLAERHQSVSESVSAPAGKVTEYATKEELAALSAVVEALKREVEEKHE